LYHNVYCRAHLETQQPAARLCRGREAIPQCRLATQSGDGESGVLTPSFLSMDHQTEDYRFTAIP